MIETPAVVDALFARVLRTALVGWLDRQQQEAPEYLLEENRVLRGQLRGRRLRLCREMLSENVRSIVFR